MKNKLKLSWFLILSILFIYSCRQEELENQDRSKTAKSEINTKFSRLGGKKKKNPYTIENMRKALKKLKKTKSLKKIPLHQEWLKNLL